MATNYPYYIPVRLDGGQLKKIFGQSKFNTFMDAVNALKTKCHRMESILGNLFARNQFVILEYTNLYDSKIVAIFNYAEDKLIYVNMPVVMSK